MLNVPPSEGKTIAAACNEDGATAGLADERVNPRVVVGHLPGEEGQTSAEAQVKQGDTARMGANEERSGVRGDGEGRGWTEDRWLNVELGGRVGTDPTVDHGQGTRREADDNRAPIFVEEGLRGRSRRKGSPGQRAG